MENAVLRFDELSIDEHDVYDCQDIETLKFWQVRVNSTLQQIRLDLDLARFQGNPTYNVARARTKKNKLGQFSQLIQNRLSELRQVRKKVDELSFERAFIEVAKEMLGKEKYLDMVRIAREKIDK